VPVWNVPEQLVNLDAANAKNKWGSFAESINRKKRFSGERNLMFLCRKRKPSKEEMMAFFGQMFNVE